MYFDDFNFYILKDEPWLQQLIREKLNPDEVFQREGYTHDDVIAYFIQNQEYGTIEFLGSPKAKFCYRLFYPNLRVVEPHIMGDMKYLRTFTKLATDFMFIKNNIDKINVYTHIPSIQRLMVRFGFKEEGTLSETYLLNNELIDIKILGYSKKDYNKGI